MKGFPVPLFVIAIPVLHSSGAWIASTSAAGYLAGTLSSTWVGAFVLGNSSLLASLGLVSAAGIFGASGGLAALTSSAALSIGSALTSVGLGSVATAFGIAPVATFLGLTPAGWAIGGAAVTSLGGLGYIFTRKVMRKINEERAKGGLPPTTIRGILKEVRLLEAETLKSLLARLAENRDEVTLTEGKDRVTINGESFRIGRLRYQIDPDGSEVVIFVSRTGRNRRILVVKSAQKQGGQPA